MRTTSVLAIAAAITFVGCAQRAMEVDTGAIEVLSWSATLDRLGTDSLAAPLDMIGSVSLRPSSNPSETRATVMLSNATPNATLPWHVHAGGCDTSGGIVGPPDSYRPLTVGPDGKADITVTLPFSMPTAGNYSINVHKSAAEMNVIIACGALSMAAAPMR